MSEEIKNTPEEIEAVKAEDLEDTVEKENDAEAVTEDISTEEIVAEEPAAEAVAPAPVMKVRLLPGTPEASGRWVLSTSLSCLL